MGSYTNQLCLSELNELSVVPESTRPIHIHMDILIHGVHYMMIEPDQTLAIFYDDLIIKPDQLYQALANLPQEQITLHGDYVPVEDDEIKYNELTDDELEAIDRSGTVNTSGGESQ